MSRYFFHTEDGQSVRDDEGVELANLDCAKVEAVGLLAEMLRNDPKTVWGTGDFCVIVTDVDQLVLFRVDVTATMAGAASRTSQYG